MSINVGLFKWLGKCGPFARANISKRNSFSKYLSACGESRPGPTYVFMGINIGNDMVLTV